MTITPPGIPLPGPGEPRRYEALVAARNILREIEDKYQLSATEEKVVRIFFVAAQRAGGKPSIDPRAIPALDRAAAYRIVGAQQAVLGEETALIKTLIHPDGVGAAAPIWRSRVGYSPGFVWPASGLPEIKGLEFEIGVRLARDIVAADHLTEAAIADAVEEYFLGIEIVGTRFLSGAGVDKPTFGQALCDNCSALGYVFGGKYERGTDVDGLMISLEIDGKQIDRRPAVPGFATVLASLVAYAKAQDAHMPLKKGAVVTMGSLNGCIPLPPGSKGRVVARLEGEGEVEFGLA